MSIYKFANNLRKIRENKKLSQDDLAHLSGVNRRSVLRLENGLIKEPTIDTLLKLSASLEVDLVDLYIKDIYESHYLYKDLLSSFDILCGFKPKEEILLLEKKLNILEADPSFKGKDYELALMRLFIKKLKNNITINFLEEFEYVTSSKIKRDNLLIKNHSFLESRLIINICNREEEFKNVSRSDILENIIKTEDNLTLKLVAYSSLINSLYIDCDYKSAIDKIYEFINYANKIKEIQAFALIYYQKFLCEKKLKQPESIDSLKVANIFASHLGVPILKEMIENKSKKILLKND